MDDILYNPTLFAYNRARKLFGTKFLKGEHFDISTPDEKINNIFRAIKKELENRINMPFGVKFRSRWVHGSRSRGETIDSETAPSAELLVHFDPELAWELLSPFVANQTMEGLVPSTIKPLNVGRYPVGPYIFNAAWKLQRMAPYEKGTELISRASRFVDWFVMHKKKVDGLYAHVDPGWFKVDPSLSELRHVREDLEKSRRDVRSLAFNCQVVIMFNTLAKLAAAYDSERDMERFKDLSEKLVARIRDIMWDGENGFFYDLVGESVTRDITVAGFLPLAAEIPTRGEAERMLEWMPFVSDRVSLLEKFPEYAHTFRYVVKGLQKYGFHEQAADVATAVISYASKQNDPAKKFTPSIVALLMLIEDIIGFDIVAGRIVLHPRMPLKWAGLPVRIYEGASDLRIVCIPESDGKIDCRVYRAAQQVYDDRIDNYTHTVIDVK